MSSPVRIANVAVGKLVGMPTLPRTSRAGFPSSNEGTQSKFGFRYFPGQFVNPLASAAS
jgi:hypothetical protein